MARRKDRTQVSVDSEQIPRLEAIAKHWRTNNSAAMRQGIDYLYEQLVNNNNKISLPELKEAATNLDQISALELVGYIVDKLKNQEKSQIDILNFFEQLVDGKLKRPDVIKFASKYELSGDYQAKLEKLQEYKIKKTKVST